MSGLIYPIPHKPMLGKGSVMLDVFGADGLPTGSYKHLGNCPKFEITTTDDIAELYGSINAASSIIARALKKRKPEVSINGTDFNSDHMAVVMMGNKTSIVGDATPVVAEPLASATVSKVGNYFRTAARPIDMTTPPVVKQGVTTLVAGDDYVVADAGAGMIYFPADSAVDDAAAATIDYTPVAATLDQVDALVLPQVNCSLLFVPDPTDGQKIEVEIWKLALGPDGAVGFITDDYGNWNLKGLVLDDSANHPTCPFFRETFLI